LLDLLPEDWQAKAKELGALQRAREVHPPQEFLRLIFLYLTEGMSFAGTSVLLHMGGIMNLNKGAVYKRVQNSGEWLKWLGENSCRYNRFVVEKPVWLGPSNGYLVDAGEVVTRGNQKKYIMRHYCLDVFTLGFILPGWIEGRNTVILAVVGKMTW
jgi:hypothetical protein